MLTGCSLVIDVGESPISINNIQCASHEDCNEGENCQNGSCVEVDDPCNQLGGAEWVSACAPCEATEEICDTIDNDCDGEIDEESQQVGDACTPSDSSQGTQGDYACVNGELICVPKPMINPVDEFCDAIDNDLDQAVDEDVDETLPELTCPPNSCREKSAQVCVDGSLVNDCNVPLNSEGLDDTCDGVDDDCDGEVDEDTSEREESCGDSCLVSASSQCVDGTWVNACEEELAKISDFCDRIDNDCDGVIDEDATFTAEICVNESDELSARSVTCSDGELIRSLCDASLLLCADQLPLIPNTCDCAAFDLTDLEALDANCDGIDGEIQRSLFVHSTLGDDLQAGTERAPLQTLTEALNRQVIFAENYPQEPIPPILLSVGTYSVSESLNVTHNLSITGGYEVEMSNGALRWNRRPLAERVIMSIEETIITSEGVSPLFKIQDSTLNLSLQSLTLIAPDGARNAGIGMHSIGLMLLECELTQLLDVKIMTGTGAQGSSGASGSPSPFLRERLRGGDADSVNGGEGGDNPECCPGGTCQGGQGGNRDENGASGLPIPNTPFGAGSGGLQINVFNTPVTPAVNGAVGEQGSDATPHSLLGQIDLMSGLWSSLNDGVDAETGSHGGGGGGGAGIPSEELSQLAIDQNLFGGGGGGGAGGCGGAPGERGGPGGWTIGLMIGEQCMVKMSTPIIERGIAEGEDTTLSTPLLIELGSGGLGGRAGVGGVGESGGTPGTSSPTIEENEALSLYYGASGGQGGCGGHGVGGNGGVAVGVIYLSAPLSSEQFVITRGQGGMGGSSLTNSVCRRNLGPNGRSGVVMDDLCCLRSSPNDLTAPCSACP